MQNVRLCENCGKNGMAVYDTREKADQLRRRRKCVYCGATFRTVELKTEEYDEMQKELQKLHSFIRELRKNLLENINELKGGD